MKQHYFVVVFAHSLHGRLKRVHIPHQALYVVLALALFGAVSAFGFVSSYVRLTWKAATVNSLRDENSTLRRLLSASKQENTFKSEQLASLQTMASEVSVAMGITRELTGTDDIASEGPLVPSYHESLEEYNFLKSASFSRLHHNFARNFHKNIIPTLWPVNGQILSRFGQRSDPFSGEGSTHWGVDISAPVGTPIHAAADGVIAEAEFSNTGYGRMVVMDHGNGLQTLYGHMSRMAVVPGQEVRRGEVIGYAGMTGRSTGPHVHFEVRMGGTPVNPTPYLTRSAMNMQQVQPDLPF